MTVPFDYTDPIAVINVWVLTWLIRRLAPKHATWTRKLTPIIAVLVAVFLRAGCAVFCGEPFSWDVVLRALAAGATAVLAHSQLRELVKASAKDALEPEKEPAPEKN